MAYTFATQRTATFKFAKSEDTERALSFNNVNATLTSAQTIINGAQRLFWITDQVSDYEPTDATRTVKQDVVNE